MANGEGVEFPSFPLFTFFPFFPFFYLLQLYAKASFTFLTPLIKHSEPYSVKAENCLDMKKMIYLIFSLFLFQFSNAQDLYFPPINGNSWETVDPESLGWCTEAIDPLLTYLDDTNTKAFIVLKDGKIALEAYFDTFTQDSLWYWASAGKTLTAFLVGIAQEEGALSLDDLTSDYLGEGWTSAPAEKEAQITIRHQLTMTSGLDDGVADVHCTLPSCLQYLADAGTRWAYHNGPYTLLTEVVPAATGINYNLFLYTRLSSKIGMDGAFIPGGYTNVMYSRPRSMARFGLMMLAGGSWDGTQIMTDTDYFHDMINTSQNLNLSYGYLWWLNGKESFMLPGLQTVFNFQAMPNAPEDTYAGLGKNGQILNVVPSMNLVMIRMGEAPGTSLPVGNIYNSDIWGYLNEVICTSTPIKDPEALKLEPSLYPNPTKGKTVNIALPYPGQAFTFRLFNGQGQEIKVTLNDNMVDLSYLPKGIYYYQIGQMERKWSGKLIH